MDFGSTNLTTSMYFYDAFLAKYDADGRFLWVRQGGGSLHDYGMAVALDATANVYLVGNFDGSARFGGTILTSHGLSDVFLVKYSSAGELLWARMPAEPKRISLGE